MSTLKQEYLLKLNQVIEEIRKDCIIAFEEGLLKEEQQNWVVMAELRGRLNNFNVLMGEDNVKALKKAGISISSRIVNKIVQKC